MTRGKGVIYALGMVLLSVAVVFVVRLMLSFSPGKVVGETAKSGDLRVGVEDALVSVMGDVVPVFSRQYPDAAIALETGSFEELFNSMNDRSLRAMLVRGELMNREAALLDSNDVAYRLEPVARDAIVCIVNAANPLPSLSVEELADIYTAKRSEWGSNVPESGAIRPYLNSNDSRLQLRFLALAAPAEEHLTAWHAGSDREVAEFVSVEKGAVGIVTLSGLKGLMASEELSSLLRVVPLMLRKGGVPVKPSRHSVYQGSYPLGYIVYFMYRKQEALPAGFGAWLGKEGQKYIEQSGLTPYRQKVRVINLK